MEIANQSAEHDHTMHSALILKQNKNGQIHRSITQTDHKNQCRTEGKRK